MVPIDKLHAEDRQFELIMFARHNARKGPVEVSGMTEKMGMTNGWDGMSHNKQIFAYEMNKQDKALADMVDIILRAYDDSMKPHTALYDDEDVEVRFGTLHTPAGYSFVLFERNEPSWIYTTDDRIEDFIHHVFLTKGAVANAGQYCSWKRVVESRSVQQALQERYGSSTLEILYPYHHLKYGECLVCSELINDKWEDGYYNFSHDGGLIRIGKAR